MQFGIERMMALEIHDRLDQVAEAPSRKLTMFVLRRGARGDPAPDVDLIGN